MNWFTTAFAWARKPKEPPPRQPPYTAEEQIMVDWIERADLDSLEAKWRYEAGVNGPWTTGRVGSLFLDKLTRLRRFRDANRDPWEDAR